MDKELTDTDLMPFGKHKGTEMQDVPASYLLWLWDEMDGGLSINSPDSQRVYNYIEDNLEVLNQELKNKKL